MTNIPVPPRTVTAYSRVWVDCTDCEYRLRTLSFWDFPLASDVCPSCLGQGGWFTEPPTGHPEPGAH